MIRWVELSMYPERKRYQALSAALKEAGCENEVEFIEVDQDHFEASLGTAQEQFVQLRLGGELCRRPVLFSSNMSTLMFALKSADAYVRKGPDGVAVRSHEFARDSNHTWWPENYLQEGLRRALVADVKALDFSGSVFILGAGSEAHAIVAALARIGFNRFSVSDPDEATGKIFVEEAGKSFFGNRIQFVPRHLITQLPSVHSVVVNTLVRGRDQGILDELYYFNFLKFGGVWLDLPFDSNQDLDSEAGAVGAIIEPGYRVAAWTDLCWASEVLGVQLSIEALAKAYKNIRES